MFENIFNMVMDVKRKTKNNIKVRMNTFMFCFHKNIEFIYDGSWFAKLKVSFTLNKNAQLFVYQWHKSLGFPDGHASNISRLMNLKDCKLYEIMIHDCHVFLQTLISLAYRDLLPEGICDALTKISHFFRDICSNKC
jgi:hypothetical protein